MVETRPLKPKPVKQGATIGVVSPASRPPDDEKYKCGIEYLRKLGYRVVESRHVLDQHGYLAGKDQDRVQDLNLMFQDDQIDAIICSRGGYGTPRIIDQVDFNLINSHPKVFVGYSDITSLSLAIWQTTGLITFSGPMVAVEMGKGIEPFTEKSFWKALTSVEPIGKLKNPDNAPLKVIGPGKARGRLLGGCLSLINVLMGTPYLPDFEEAILFIEDIDEQPYGVDRYLAQMKMAGVLDQISGVVLGQFVDCTPTDPEKPSLKLEQIFEHYFSDLKIPVLANFAYGHVPVKNTLPIGAMAELDTENGGLFITEAAVQNDAT
ncbi:MAG: LD-carboxypeptidase [bacterium]|nr:LD-carboxypeptidase [bacterium]